jgi:asparagine synthase (glutamine-hydrolysing)
MVARHIGSVHQTFIVTIEEALAAIDEVIYTIETWDTTTIRASVWQYLI